MSTYEQSVAAIDKRIVTEAAYAKAADAKLAEAIAAANAAIANATADAAAAKVAERAQADAREFATHAASANSGAEKAAKQHYYLQKYHDDYDHNINCSEWSFSWNRNEFYFEALDAYKAFLRMNGCKVKQEENRQDDVVVYVTRQPFYKNMLCILL